MKRENSIALVGVVMFIAVGLFFLFTRGKSEPIYTTCESFKSQQEAQDYFIENNAVHLDRDKDGVACEELEIAPINPQTIFIPRSTPKPIQIPESIQNQTPQPATIKLEGESTLIVTTPEPKEPTPEPTKEPTPSPSPEPTPTVTPLVCVLGLCL